MKRKRFHYRYPHPNQPPLFSRSPLLFYLYPIIFFLLLSTVFAKAQTCGGCGTNLITNPDFQGGNTGYGSTLVFTNTFPLSAGQYTIRNDASIVDTNWHASDHTGPPHQVFAIVNGASTISDVLTESIPVQQNTNYTFCFWVTNLVHSGLNLTDPNIAAAINGSIIGSSGPLTETNTSTGTVWKQVSVSWFSGLNTTANLAIRPMVTDTSGNDFGIDDISFVQTTAPIAIAGPDWTICAGSSKVIGFPSLSAGLTYSWSPADGLNNSTIPQPTASPEVTTSYTLTVTAPGGCTATDAIVITVNPTANAGPDKSICPGGSTIIGTPAVAGTFYYWSPLKGLNNSIGAQPKASPLVTTTYTLTTITSMGCISTDVVIVKINSRPSITGTTTPTFQGTATGSININVTGGVTPYTFIWSNGAITEDITALAVGNYTVTVVSATGCSAAAVFRIYPLPAARDSEPSVAKTKGLSKPTELTKEPSVNLYPNPNNGEFTVAWDTDATNVRIQVYNVVGELVADRIVVNENKYNMDISSSQPKGMYIVKVTIGSNTIVKKVTNQ